MVDHPFRLLVEESTAGVDVDLVIIDESTVTAFVIFPSRMEKESRNDGLPNQGVVLATGFYGMSALLKQLDQLLSHIFSSPQRSLLYKVLLRPSRTITLISP
jgi:hypothetical protein